MAVLGVWCLLMLTFHAVVSSTRPASTAWQILSLLAWIVLAVAPVGRFFFVAPDLLGGRYLYLPAVGWAMLLIVLAGAGVGQTSVAGCSRGSRDDLAGLDRSSTLVDLNGRDRRARLTGSATLAAGASVSSGRPAARLLSLAPLLVLGALYAWGTLRHIEPWHRAGLERDRLLAEVRAHAAREHCDRIAVDRIPGSIEGAFVFRNGLPEAVAIASGSRIRIEMPGTDVPARCRIRTEAARRACDVERAAAVRLGRLTATASAIGSRSAGWRPGITRSWREGSDSAQRDALVARAGRKPRRAGSVAGVYCCPSELPPGRPHDGPRRGPARPHS